MFLSCHVRVWEWIHTLQLPECQGTPCSKFVKKGVVHQKYSIIWDLWRSCLKGGYWYLSILSRLSDK